MASSELIILLDKAKQEHEVVSIFSDMSDRDRCAVGYVKEISSGQILLENISTVGLYDGYTVRKIENIFRVDIGGMYEKRISQLYEGQKQQHITDFLDKGITATSNLFVEVLREAKNRNMVIAICINDETEIDIMGRVDRINDSDIVINKLTPEGFDDGKSALYVSDISKLFCDDDEARALGILNEINKRKH